MITRALPKVYVIVLNWNNAEDTLECLESLCRLDYANRQIVVCDNASSDGSVDAIAAWARGERRATTRSADPELRALSVPPVEKPLSCAILDAPVAGQASSAGGDAEIVVLRLPENRGYASGNNAGMRFALERGDADCLWILNNDTVAAPRALSALVERAGADPSIGLCGSLLLFYHDPRTVQAAGGATYNAALALPSNIGEGETVDRLPPDAAIEQATRFIVGASIFVTRRFVDTVGLMAEDYFLYFEELDWILRARGRFRLAFARASRVYHKEGASAGSSANWRLRSEISDLCAVRNRLLVTRRYFPHFYPTVFASLGVALLRRLLRRQPRRALQILRIMIAPGSYRLPVPRNRG